jgi:hypothetical protein
MKKIMFLIFSITLFSCQSYKLTRKESRITYQIKIQEGPFHTSFKNEVLARSLKLLYPKEFSILFNSVDGTSIGNSDYLLIKYNQLSTVIDSIAIAFSNKPEAKSEYELKKLTMDACIAYRNGPELDSITKAIYKKYKIKDLYKD